MDILSLSTGKPGCETSLDYLQAEPRQILKSGPIVVWCTMSHNKLKKANLYMRVVLGSQEHFCVLYTDNSCQFRLGHFNLKNCKVVEAVDNDKKFEVHLHVSEKAGLHFEAATKYAAKEWKDALMPRITSNSPAVSLQRLNRNIRE